jgi:glycosyltransferase involved in cell wall biosynthesis/Tfp pilus assembly protein PilF
MQQFSNNKYSILFVHSDHPLSPTGIQSGAENATRALAKAFVQKGYTVNFAAIINQEEVVVDGVHYWDLGEEYAVNKALRRQSNLGPYVLIAACRGLAILQSLDDPMCKARIFAAHDPTSSAVGVKPKILSKSVDKIVCVSNAQANLFIDEGADKEKIAIIPNGVDKTIFCHTLKNYSHKRLIFSGAIVPDKGLDILLNAFSMLRHRVKEVTLDVYGSASLWNREDYLKTETIELPGVTFHGKVSQRELAKGFQEASVCIIPSRWFDSFPLTSLEAQACGCPVVAFNVGGIRETLVQNETGILVHSITPEALAEEIYTLLTNPGLFESMSKKAVQFASNHSWEHIAKRYEKIVYAIPENAAHSNTLTKITNETKEKSSLFSPSERYKVGIVTTWNQPCGLAGVAAFLTKHLHEDEYTICAEKTDTIITSSDASNVIRVWSREDGNYEELLKALLENECTVIHFNCHTRFFHNPQFTVFLKELQKRHIGTIFHLHSTYTFDESLKNLIQCIDAFIVHTLQNRLELIAHGVDPEKIRVIPLGVPEFSKITSLERKTIRQELGVDDDTKLLFTFGFLQAHKGLDGMIDVVNFLKPQWKVKGYISGTLREDDEHSQQYVKLIKKYCQEKNVEKEITIDIRYQSDETLVRLVQASDLVMLNYHSQHFESSGVAAMIIGLGTPVITSLAPPFITLEDAAWKITSGYPPTLSSYAVLSNNRLQKELIARADEYAAQNSWKNISKHYKALYQCYSKQYNTYHSVVKEELYTDTQNNFEPITEKIKNEVIPGTELKNRNNNITLNNKGTVMGKNVIRVLMQVRSNVWTHPGGDSVLVDNFATQLRNRNIFVTIDTDNKLDPAQYDIVHLFNFALPEMLRNQAEKAYQKGVPYVVTPLAEDAPKFLNQSFYAFEKLIQWVQRGQQEALDFRKQFQNTLIQPSLPFDNKWVVERAACIMACGEVEKSTILKSYGNFNNIELVHFGFDRQISQDDNAFSKEIGLKDYVLCVGRIEHRKNQLMLLKALEDVGIPVVLAGSNFSYQQDYLAAVNKFQRRGVTKIVGRLSAEMLASAYRGAKVHVLPSWYELPGLVTLEAAWNGCNVVATTNGTIEDYIGNDGFYCEPHDEYSIRNAVLAAYHGDNKTQKMQQRLECFTWENSAQKIHELYQNVLKGRQLQNEIDVNEETTLAMKNKSDEREEKQTLQTLKTVNMPIQESIQVNSMQQENSLKDISKEPKLTFYDGNAEVIEYQECIEKADFHAKQGDFVKAHEMYDTALQYSKNNTRVYRNKAATYLAEGFSKEAREWFQKALSIDSEDIRSLSGLGMTEMMEGHFDFAYTFLLRSLKKDYKHLPTLYKFIECCYTVSRFDDLGFLLEEYVKSNPSDNEMRFCLAGCLYKQNKRVRSRSEVSIILNNNPMHSGALQLSELLEKDFSSAGNALSMHQNTSTSLNEKRLETAHNNTEQYQSTVANVNMPFTTNDEALVRLEEERLRKNYDTVIRGCHELMSREIIRPDQRELAQLILAECYLQMGNDIESKNLFTLVLEKNPVSTRCICGLASHAAAAGAWSDAESLFERALFIDKQSDRALAGLGMCAQWIKDEQRAWDLYMKALALNSENMQALFGIIELGYKMGMLREVETSISNYLELHPANLDLIYALAGCYFAQEKIEEAKLEVEKIRLFEPHNRKAAELDSLIANREKTDKNEINRSGVL